jgi:hypothetical protein
MRLAIVCSLLALLVGGASAEEQSAPKTEVQAAIVSLSELGAGRYLVTFDQGSNTGVRRGAAFAIRHREEQHMSFALGEIVEVEPARSRATIENVAVSKDLIRNFGVAWIALPTDKPSATSITPPTKAPVAAPAIDELQHRRQREATTITTQLQVAASANDWPAIEAALARWAALGDPADLPETSRQIAMDQMARLKRLLELHNGWRALRGFDTGPAASVKDLGDPVAGAMKISLRTHAEGLRLAGQLVEAGDRPAATKIADALAGIAVDYAPTFAKEGKFDQAESLLRQADDAAALLGADRLRQIVLGRAIIGEIRASSGLAAMQAARAALDFDRLGQLRADWERLAGESKVAGSSAEGAQKLAAYTADIERWRVGGRMIAEAEAAEGRGDFEVAADMWQRASAARAELGADTAATQARQRAEAAAVRSAQARAERALLDELRAIESDIGRALEGGHQFTPKGGQEFTARIDEIGRKNKAALTISSQARELLARLRMRVTQNTSAPKKASTPW